MARSQGALSPLWRFSGFLVLVAVIAGSIAVARLLTPRSIGGPVIFTSAVPLIILGILGLISLTAAVAFYGLVLLTRGFTFDFSRPFMRALGRKLWPCDIIVKLLASAGFTLMVGPMLALLLWEVLPTTTAHPLGFFGSFLISQFFLMWLQIWGPLDRRLIVRRMRAIHLPPDRIATGLLVGTSNVDKKRRRWFRMVIEDDMGMMWFDEDRIVFLGDLCPWSITRDQLLRIERAAMKSATSAYFGAVHVILHFARPDTTTGCIRLHRPGVFTQSANSRALDDLADRLESWESGGRSLPLAIGFAVVVPQPSTPANQLIG